jgi:PHD/YefM family antitoxin component YafN of YafNO toxin-antitoxin module
MLNTHVRPSRALRNNYREIVDLLNQHDHVVITNNGVGESVLVNMEVFARFEDYLHQHFIHEELQKSKDKLADSNVKLTDATTVFDKLKKKRDGNAL